jgi:hypothetical protein
MRSYPETISFSEWSQSIVELNSKTKFDATSTWEFQRLVYLQSASSLNPEFEHYKQANGITSPSDDVVEYRLSEQAPFPKVVHLPKGYRRLQVLNGRAWMSYKGRDYVLKAGDEIPFNHDSQDAVISASGKITLSFRISR